MTAALPLACCVCHGGLRRHNASLRCAECGEVYRFNRFGYAELLRRDQLADSTAIDPPEAEYAEDQHATGVRVADDYLRPVLAEEPFRTVLDVGCGVGAGIRQFAASGYDAYGVDLPGLSRYWAEAGNDPSRFLCGDAVELPFATGFFDVVYSLGVIEHIGTVTGHCTLRADFQVQRERYAREIVRVTKPGGRILIGCPNRSFPVDIQHGPTDGAGARSPLRTLLFNKTGINLHKTWGRYHLLSFGEVRNVFCRGAGARHVEALPLANYFAFGRFKTGFLRPFARLAELYIHHLPTKLRATFLNPYVLVQIRK